MSPFDSPEFWNPKMRGPVCYNPAATRSILPITRYRTKLAQSGVPERHMFDEIRAAIARKEPPATNIATYTHSRERSIVVRSVSR